MPETVMISRWRPAAVLRVRGEDAFTFLQGQFTNDLRELHTKDAVYGLWLNHKGRVIADSFVRQRGQDEFLIMSYFCPAELIRERLEAFIIADDVTIEDVTSDWRGITLLGAAFTEIGTDWDGEAVRFRGRRTNGLHEELVFPAALEESIASRLQGLREMDAEALQRIRIQAAIPAVPMDIGRGELPNEGGLEMPAISYVKGCYLGQEVMARLKSMGQVRRRLFHVRGNKPGGPASSELFQGERRIGEIRTRVPTANGFEALALLSLIHLKPDLDLSFSAAGEPEVSIVESK